MVHMPLAPAEQAAWGRQALVSGRAQQIREAAGVTRSELAADLGVSESCLYRWENGQRTPYGASLLLYVERLRRLERLTKRLAAK